MKREPSDKMCKCPFCGRVFREESVEAHLTDRMCMVCGHVWMSRGSALPRRCPACRSTEWNVRVKEQLECRRCGHRWFPRGTGTPMMCPRCKSIYWRGVKEEPESASEDDLRRAVARYSEGEGCVEISLSTGIPLEAIVLKIREIREGAVRMSSGQT